MKISLILGLALLSGCATTGAMAPTASGDHGNASEARCTLLGELVYNPRGGLIDPLNAVGPVRVLYVNPDQPFLVNMHGNLYQCVNT